MACESGPSGAAPARPMVIAVGNQKGGTGKSTTAIHLSVALSRAGLSVGVIDLDMRQATLSRYLENREAYAAAQGLDLPVPRHLRVEADADGDAEARLAAARAALADGLASLSGCDIAVLDTPGGLSSLARAGHEAADTLVTPVNDSYLDVDVLARIDRARREVLAPSAYSRMVWEAHNRRVLEGQPAIDWIVMRNRLTHIDARNKRDIGRLIELLGARLGFRTAPGFGERMVFRELFATGQTVFDLDEARLSPSQSAARREVEALVAAVALSAEAAA